MNQLSLCEVGVFEPIKFDWIYLERLSSSSCLANREYIKTDFGSNGDLHMSRLKRIIKVLNLKAPIWFYSEKQLKKTAFVIYLV